MNGLTVTGKYLGFRTTPFKNPKTQQQQFKTEIGLAFPAIDGWGQEKEFTQAITLTQKSVDAGLPSMLTNCVGKELQLPVWAGKFGGEIFLDNDKTLALFNNKASA